VNPAALRLSENMTNQPIQPQSDPLDELVTNLLSCGGVLSQLISGMVEFEASGLSAPDSAPIPEVAHSLIRGVLEPVRKQFSKRDIRQSGKIVSLVTDQMCSEIYAVSPEFIAEALNRPPHRDRGPSG
jgi:hypothetical protein